jgi:hypothetical protein
MYVCIYIYVYVYIGVAAYLKSRDQTEKRGSGSALGPVQCMLQLWFPPLSRSIQKWQELFVISCFKDQSLDNMLLEMMRNLVHSLLALLVQKCKY